MSAAKVKRVALYLRVSTGSQTTDNQRRELEAAAERHGWQVVRVFEDAGISAAGDTPAGSAATPTLESAALSSLAPVDGFAASSAHIKSGGIRKTANAAVAIVFRLNLIVVSCTARRDDRNTTAAG